MGGTLHIKTLINQHSNNIAANRALRLSAQLGSKGLGYDHYYRIYFKAARKSIYAVLVIVAICAATVVVYFAAGQWYFWMPLYFVLYPVVHLLVTTTITWTYTRKERKRRPHYYDPMGRR